MKKNFVLAAAIAMLALAFTASAQKAPADFSGKWNLDLAKSKLTDREKASIESQTVTITQTAADIKIETETKRMAPPAGAPAGGPPGGGRMGGGGAAGPQTFLLGKEATTDQQMGQNTVPVTAGSKWDGSKLVTSRSFTMNGPNGEMKNSTKQTFELGADGKTLTITVESTGMQSTTSTKVFTKS
ncbi:MAG: hypothetical protein ABL999_18290 [Pyrinomonadaceae bacterium]